VRTTSGSPEYERPNRRLAPEFETSTQVSCRPLIAGIASIVVVTSSLLREPVTRPR